MSKKDSLEEIHALTQAHQALVAQVASQQQTMARTIPMIFGSPAMLAPLFGRTLRNPEPTSDGKGVSYLVGDFIIVEIYPTGDFIDITNSLGGIVPRVTVPMTNGCLDEDSQLMLIGAAARITLAHKAGVDPVTMMMDLGVMPVTPATESVTG